MSPVVSALEPIDRLSLISFFPWALQHDRTRSDKERLLANIAPGTWPTPTLLYHSTSEFSWLIILYSLNFKLIFKKKPCHHAVSRILIAQNLRLSPTAP